MSEERDLNAETFRKLVNELRKFSKPISEEGYITLTPCKGISLIDEGETD